MNHIKSNLYTLNSIMSTLHNVTHSLISWNPRERMFVVQISFLIVTFPSRISRILSLMQITKEVNRHPLIVPYVNMWSVTFLFLFFLFFLCHLLVHAYVTSSRKVKWSKPHHIIRMLHFCYSIVSSYTKSIVSRNHVNTTKLRNITCTLVVTCVKLRSLECIWIQATETVT